MLMKLAGWAVGLALASAVFDLLIALIGVPFAFGASAILVFIKGGAQAVYYQFGLDHLTAWMTHYDLWFLFPFLGLIVGAIWIQRKGRQ